MLNKILGRHLGTSLGSKGWGTAASEWSKTEQKGDGEGFPPPIFLFLSCIFELQRILVFFAGAGVGWAALAPALARDCCCWLLWLPSLELDAYSIL